MGKLPDYQFTISLKTLFLLTGFILSLYLMFALRDVILALFISILIAMAINPYVVKLEHRGVRRSLGITLIFGMIVTSIILLFAALMPPFVQELYSLANAITIPDALKLSLLNLEYSLQDLAVIVNQLKGIPKIIDAVSTVFSVLIITVTFSVVTFYLLMERPVLHKYLVWAWGHSKDEAKVEHFVNSLETQIGGWVRGELILMFSIGLLTYICLIMLGLPYALPLAILAGLLEIIPNVGPTIAAVPALIIAYTNGSFAYLGLVGVIYIIIQQIENSLVVPRIMKQATGIHPLITILVMIIGLRLGGFLGAFIAVPLVLSVKVLAVEIYKLRLPADFES